VELHFSHSSYQKPTQFFHPTPIKKASHCCKAWYCFNSGFQKAEKVMLGNYIDKVDVVREVNRQGFGYFGS
jgi:hypothetical protein